MDDSSSSRKRRSDNPRQESDSQSDDTPEVTSSGRPKRRCTINQKKIYTEADTTETKDPDYKEDDDVLPKLVTPKKIVTPTRPASSGLVILDPHKVKKPATIPELLELKAQYKWIDHDQDTGKIKCRICLASNLRKWFIIATENNSNLTDSLRLHESSEEHRRASVVAGNKSPAGSKSTTTLPPVAPRPTQGTITIQKLPNTQPVFPRQNSQNNIRDIYCIPMECVDPIPLPGAQLRNLLARHGLKGRVNFASDLTPAKLREDISKAFSKTFNLRMQELLQFDYLALSKDNTELTKPVKMLHYDAKTVLSFVGDNEIYILLKQKAPAQNVDWKQLLFQENKLRTLDDSDYKEVMLSVMHRLSSGKHKKDSSEEQKTLVESLIKDYKLNNYHQLVYIGNSFDQLVLFTDKRRFEAFKTSHNGHPDLQTTYKKIFKQYYWNGVEEWVTVQVKNCQQCLSKYGAESLAAAAINTDKVEEELYIARKGTSKQPTQSQIPLAPRPAQQTVFVQRIVPLPKPAASTIKVTVAAAPKDKNNKGSSPSITSTRSMSSSPTDYPVASIIPPPMTMPIDDKEPAGKPPLSPSEIKKEPEESFDNDGDTNDLLPPEDNSVPEEDRDGTLYEEDLEQAISQNSKDMSDGSHCVNAMWSMYLLQQRGMFCDFFIMLLPSVSNNLKKPKIYGVHRIVFASISSRIRKITKTTIKIGGKVTCEGLENVIEYSYTGRLTGIHEMQIGNITQVSNTAMALDIKIDHYLQKYRPDYVKTSAKILVTRNPGDKEDGGSEAKMQKPFVNSP